MVLGLPKVPKLDDVVAAVIKLDERVAVLEAYVSRNDARITVLESERIGPLEHDIAEHQAGAVQRERELDAVRETAARDRWLRTLRGRR